MRATRPVTPRARSGARLPHLPPRDIPHAHLRPTQPRPRGRDRGRAPARQRCPGSAGPRGAGWQRPGLSRRRGRPAGPCAGAHLPRPRRDLSARIPAQLRPQARHPRSSARGGDAADLARRRPGPCRRRGGARRGVRPHPDAARRFRRHRGGAGRAARGLGRVYLRPRLDPRHRPGRQPLRRPPDDGRRRPRRHRGPGPRRPGVPDRRFGPRPAPRRGRGKGAGRRDRPGPARRRGRGAPRPGAGHRCPRRARGRARRPGGASPPHPRRRLRARRPQCRRDPARRRRPGPRRGGSQRHGRRRDRGRLPGDRRRTAPRLRAPAPDPLRDALRQRPDAPTQAPLTQEAAHAVMVETLRNAWKPAGAR